MAHLDINVLKLNSMHVHMLLFGTVVYKFRELYKQADDKQSASVWYSTRTINS